MRRGLRYRCLRVPIIIVVYILCAPSSGYAQLSQLPHPIIIIPSDGTTINRPADYASSVNSDTMFVLDYGDKCVYAFTGDGRFLFKFGRDGMGPGEFMNPIAINVNNYEVYILDSRLRRISVFYNSGKYKKTVSLPAISSDIAIYNNTIYTRSTRDNGIIWEINQNSPDDRKILLTWEESRLNHVSPIERGLPTNISLLDKELITAIPSLGTLVVVDLENSDPQVTYIDPKSEFLETYWARFEEMRRRREREGRSPPAPNPISRIGRWENEEIFLELSSLSPEEYRSIVIVIDKETGLDTGWGIYTRTEIYVNFKPLGNNQYGWISAETAEIHVFNLDRRKK
jgi:hypothetical protein